MSRRRPKRRDELANIVADPPSLDLVQGPSVSDVFGGSAPIRNTQPVVFLPFGRTLVHAPGARRARNPYHTSEHPLKEPVAKSSPASNTGLISFSPLRASNPAVSKFRRKKERQYERWTTDVIPGLVQPYLELLRKTENLRLSPNQTNSPACTCQGIVPLTTTCVSFSGEWFALVG